jgi:hypothetical protein
MERGRLLLMNVAILVIALCMTGVACAVPMGTAFTYEGLLYDANSPADGEYDFKFKLFHDPNYGPQWGPSITMNNLDVIEGHFSAKLDFGSDPNVFGGQARWLEVKVRPGDSTDANDWDTQRPRQELTPTPYALYASVAEMAKNAIGGGGNFNYIARFNDTHFLGNSTIYEAGGKVGIGTTTLDEKFNVAGGIKVLASNTGIHAEGGIYAVRAENTSTSNFGALGDQFSGLVGIHGPTSNRGRIGGDTYGVYGEHNSKGNTGYLGRQDCGVYGKHNNTGNYGILGDPNSGVYGVYSSTGNSGTLGHANYGVYGKASSQSSVAVYGKHNDTGNYGILGNSLYGGYFDATALTGGVGVYGQGDHTGVKGEGDTYGVSGFSVSGYGVFGASSSGTAGYFNSASGYGLIVDNGNVGIGTPNPQAKLTVNGAILRDGSTMYGANANTHINLGTTSTTGTAGQHYSSATVGGGSNNTAGQYSATVGGGYFNTASETYATVGGGANNTASGQFATVGGGINNDADGMYSTVPGGHGNVANGDNSFTAGNRAKAYHDGVFIWADSNDVDFTSTSNDQFLIRASGGVGIGTNNPKGALDVNGAIYQRGSQVHADYVFESDYNLESIEEHTKFMWQHKHLKAIPKAKVDTNGMEIVEVGSHRKGIVEELEKAHIYIEQLHKKNQALEKRLADMEATVSKLINSNEGGQL